MPRVAILGFDDFTDLDLFLPFDLLSRVPGLDVQIVAEQKTIRSHAGLAIEVHDHARALARADGVFVASGPGTRALAAADDLAERLPLNPEHQRIAAVDSGALILAALGLLRGLEATTYPSAELHESLAQLGAVPVERRLVSHDRVATGARCLAGVDLVRWLACHFAPRDAVERALTSAAALEG